MKVNLNIKYKRLIAIILDFYIILYILGILDSLFFKMSSDTMEILIHLALFYIVFWVVYCFKDCIFGNASIGKKIMKIKIVKTENTNSNKIGITSHILRAVPLLIFPLELVLVLSNNKRLGDKLSKTIIVDA